MNFTIVPASKKLVMGLSERFDNKWVQLFVEIKNSGLNPFTQLSKFWIKNRIALLALIGFKGQSKIAWFVLLCIKDLSNWCFGRASTADIEAK